MTRNITRDESRAIARVARRSATWGERLHVQAFLDGARDLLEARGLTLPVASSMDGSDLWTLDAMARWLRQRAIKMDDRD